MHDRAVRPVVAVCQRDGLSLSLLEFELSFDLTSVSCHAAGSKTNSEQEMASAEEMQPFPIARRAVVNGKVPVQL